MPLGADVSVGFIRLKAAAQITIVSGVLTATQSEIIVDAEGAGTTDDLATINIDSTLVMVSGYTEALLLKARTGDTITVKHGTGNIFLASAADFSLTGEKTLMLVRMSSASNWNDIAGSN